MAKEFAEGAGMSPRKLAFAASAFLLALATVQVAHSAEPAGAAKSGAPDVGRLTYEKWCAPCHAPGPDHPGTQALDALYKGSKPGALIERKDLTPAIVKQFVRKGVSVMPFFRKTEISDTELDALAAFLSK
jgi:mono/diheme cytochrome c family protein